MLEEGVLYVHHFTLNPSVINEHALGSETTDCFTYYEAEHFFKELVRPKLTGIKVRAVRVAGVIVLRHIVAWTVVRNEFCHFE